MPSNTEYLTRLAAHNERLGITSTFSEMKKTARRLQKLHDAREPTDPDAFSLDYEDPTGEEATENVMTERAATNAHNAHRRLAA